MSSDNFDVEKVDSWLRERPKHPEGSFSREEYVTLREDVTRFSEVMRRYLDGLAKAKPSEALAEVTPSLIARFHERMLDVFWPVNSAIYWSSSDDEND